MSAFSAEAYTTTVLMMVDRVKGGGCATPPPLTRLGWIYHHEGMYARKLPLPVYLYFLVCGRSRKSKSQACNTSSRPFHIKQKRLQAFINYPQISNSSLEICWNFLHNLFSKFQPHFNPIKLTSNKNGNVTNTLQLLLFGPKEVSVIFLNKQRLLFLPHN